MRVIPLSPLAAATLAGACASALAPLAAGDACTEGSVIAWGAGNPRTFDERTSGSLGNIGVGVSRQHLFTNLPTSVADNALLTIQARADIGDANEFLTIRFNNVVVGEAFNQVGQAVDCAPGYSTAVFAVSPATWASFAKAGSLEIRLNASAQVDPNQCADGDVIIRLSIPPGIWPHYGQATVPGALFPQERISAGSLNTAGIDRFGQLAVWGDNEYGQRNVPVLPGTGGWAAVAVGGQHVLGLRTNGDVVGWGWNSNGQATPPVNASPASSIAAGGRHSLSRTPSGQVRAWGANDYNQSLVPSGIGTSVFIAAGADHSMSINSLGILRCWGNNAQGQCTVPNDLPVALSAAGGEQHTVMLLVDGSIRCFGGNQYGQCDIPADLPAASAVAAGLYHTVVLTDAGRVVCFGAGSRIRYGTPFSGGQSAFAAAIDGDGSTLVGSSQTSTILRPLRWGLAGNPRQMTLPTGCWSTDGRALDISADYSFGGPSGTSAGSIVGAQTIAGGERAIRATAGGTAMTVLANPNGSWIMDGVRDADAILLAQSSDGSRHLWAGVKCGRLYMATEAAGSGDDVFAILATPPGVLKPAPSGKAGEVATWKAYLRQQAGSATAGWFNENNGAIAANGAGAPTTAVGAVVEGTIDLAGLFPTFLAEFSLVVAPYEPGTGGALLENELVPPAVTFDGSVLPREFITRTTLGETIGDATYSRARGVNTDGSVIVGEYGEIGDTKAFRWTQGTGMISLGLLPGGAHASASSTSGDGDAVVGTSDSIDGERAFLWTGAGGIASLGVLDGGLFSIAHKISADGSTVVGESDSTDGGRAFLWTSAGGMVDLGTLPGCIASAALAVSGDGSTVVGTCVTAKGENRAFLWTVSTGLVDLNTYLPSIGVVIGSGVLAEANDISDDGSTIVGNSVAAGVVRPFAAELAPLAAIPSNGGPNYGQCWPTPTNLPIIAIAAGGYHTAAITGGIGNCYDLNGDGVVDAADLSILLLRWGPAPPGPPPYPDFNGDGIVDAADLSALLLNWGG